MNKRSPVILVAAWLFGALAWLSVSMGEQYQITITAPLTIQEIPEGWAIRTPVPRNIQLRYRGDGWRLALLHLGADVRLRPAFSALRPTGDPSSRVLTYAEITELAPSRAGTVLVNVNPDSLVLTLERYAEKRVPVRLDIHTTVREGYGMVGGATASPESVTVGGAESVVASLPSWPTVRASFTDLRAPLETEIELADGGMRMLTFSMPSVHVSLNIQPFAEKILSGIPIDLTGAPPYREIILIPPKLDLVARGGIKQLAALNTSDFHVSVSYRAILADTTGSIAPTIRGPEEIQIVSTRPERLHYILRQRL